MKPEFLLELAALLDKFEVSLMAEPVYGEYESSSVTVVFSEESVELGTWVNPGNLKNLFKEYKNNCKD